MTAVNSVASNNALPLPSAGAGLDTATLAQFQALPTIVQVGALTLDYAGNPPQQVIGPAGNPQGLATLNADGITVTTEALPSGFTLAPANIDYATFSSWSQNVQAAYMLANSAEASSDDTTLSLTCGSGNTMFTATRPVPPKLFDANDLTTIQAPDVSVGSPLGSLSVAGLTTTGYTKADIPYFQVGSAAGDAAIASKAPTVYSTPIVPSPSTTGYASLDPNVFTSWTNAQQLAYLEAQITATPDLHSFYERTITIGANNTAGHPAIQAFTGTAIDAALSKGLSNPLPAPVQVYTIPVTTTYYNLDPNVFETWTTAKQKAFIQSTYINALYFRDQGLGNPLPTPLTIGADNTAGHTAIDVFIGAGDTPASPAPVYIAQNLQKTDIAKMSFADQQMLTQATGYPALAAAYGLMPNASTPSTGATSATATIQALIASYRDPIKNSSVPPYVASLFTAQIDLISAQLFGGALPSAPVAGTTTTVPTTPTLPSPQTGGSAIFSEKDIQAQLDAIQTRFKRVEAFAAQATRYNPPIFSSFDYVDYSTGQTQHYTYSASDDIKNLFSYNNQYYTSDPAPSSSNVSPVQTDWDPSTACAEFKAIYGLSDQNIGVDPTGVHGYGQFSVSGTLNFQGQTITLNGKPVKVGTISNVVMQNPQLGFNTIQGIYPLPASTDNDVTIRSGYEKFVAQEAAITANKMLAANLAQSGTVAGSNQSLDLPKLLCLYMMYNNNIQQAVVTADSEEVNQVNAVLQEYAAAQQVINATTATSNSNANAQLQLQYGVTNVEVSRFFETSYFYHTSPIETMYFGNAWQRPLSTKFVGVAGDGSGGGGSDTANNWTQYGTQLSDVVTQINQQSQIKMNDVNSETKQQDRYFDLASTALSKLSDTLSQIASAT